MYAFGVVLCKIKLSGRKCKNRATDQNYTVTQESVRDLATVEYLIYFRTYDSLDYWTLICQNYTA